VVQVTLPASGARGRPQIDILGATLRRERLAGHLADESAERDPRVVELLQRLARELSGEVPRPALRLGLRSPLSRRARARCLRGGVT